MIIHLKLLKCNIPQEISPFRTLTILLILTCYIFEIQLQALAVAYGVEEGFLQASFDEIEHSYGSFEAFLADGLELDEGTVVALRATFVA